MMFVHPTLKVQRIILTTTEDRLSYVSREDSDPSEETTLRAINFGQLHEMK